MSSDDDKIENINSPGRFHRVGRAKCEAKREVLLAVLSESAPG